MESGVDHMYVTNNRQSLQNANKNTIRKKKKKGGRENNVCLLSTRIGCSINELKLLCL